MKSKIKKFILLFCKKKIILSLKHQLFIEDENGPNLYQPRDEFFVEDIKGEIYYLRSMDTNYMTRLENKKMFIYFNKPE